MIEIGATQAKRVFAFHEEEIALPQLLATPRALKITQDGKNDEDLWSRFVVGQRFVVKDLWSKICGQTGLEDLWSDGTGTLLDAVNRPPFF
jgi:hypothetical protein